ncbi:MAG TPA: AgmX/PglI C-terminal domain-containing protein [bacterium]|nr:AgmX/PglI C-terminal domain-containing protein [bacterium]
MSTPTLAELSREIPRKKWFDGFDRSLLIAAVCSFLFHYSLMTYIQSLPIPQTPLRLQTWEIPVAPPVAYEIPPDEPLTPQPVKTSKTSVGNAPAGSGNGGPGGPQDGLLHVLQKNPALLALIVRESDTGADIRGLSALSDKMPSIHAGVRIARRYDQPGSTDDVGNGAPIAVNLTEFGESGTVDIAKRATRQVQAQIKRARPIFTSTDAGANRLMRQALHDRLGAVKHCYERALKLNPSLAGKISVQVLFAADGSVTGASIVENTVDAGVGSCVAQALRQTRTAQPLPSAASVQVPYIFTPRD